MIFLLAALVLAAGAPATPSDVLGERIRESADAAQAMQGPMDGTWTLYAAHGRPLAILQITDPASGDGRMEAGWRGPAPDAPLSLVERIARDGAQLTVDLGPAAPTGLRNLTLARRGARVWTGRAASGGRTTPVTLRRH